MNALRERGFNLQVVRNLHFELSNIKVRWNSTSAQCVACAVTAEPEGIIVLTAHLLRL